MIESTGQFVNRNQHAFRTWLQRPLDSVAAPKQPQAERQKTSHLSTFDRLITVAMLGLIVTATQYYQDSKTDDSETEVGSPQSPDYKYMYTLPPSAALLQNHLLTRVGDQKLISERGQFNHKFIAVTTDTMVRVQVTGDEPTIVRDFPDKQYGRRVKVTQDPNRDGYYFKVEMPYNNALNKETTDTLLPGGFNLFVAVHDTLWLARFNEETDINEFIIIFDGSDLEDPFRAKLFSENPKNSNSLQEVSFHDVFASAIPRLNVPHPFPKPAKPQLV